MYAIFECRFYAEVFERMGLIPTPVEDAFNRLLHPLVVSVRVLRLSPNMISTLGVVPGVTAAFFLAGGWFVTGGILILLGGVLDMIDGKLARMTNRTTRFGALYDSTLDRFAEIAMYTGLGYYFVFQGMHLTSLMVVIAATGSIMVSYVRARAESHGFTCNVGWMRRGERIVILGGAALLSFYPQPFDAVMFRIIQALPFDWTYFYPPMPLTLAIAIVAIATPITVIQRMHEVWKQTKSDGVAPELSETLDRHNITHHIKKEQL
jgi:CDP-diacylglycerol---glycerol-3-phosphate 3-phosphatidyltransferase